MISHNENHIKQLRLKANMTIEEAATKAHIRKSYLYAIEEGRKAPGPKLKLKLSKLYGCSIREIRRDNDG